MQPRVPRVHLIWIVPLLSVIVAVSSQAPLALAKDRAADAESEGFGVPLKLEDFPALADFENVEAFQAHIDTYVKQCRDAWISSSVGSQCGIEAELWDRELNGAYRAFMGVLGSDAKGELRDSQRRWIEFRDSTLDVHRLVLDLHYDDGQRLWLPVSALDYANTLAKMTKARVLQLRHWKRLVENPVSDSM